MKRSGIKRVGSIGRANMESRKRIAVISEEKEINFCEIRFNECLGGSFLAPAHRHKRAWYQGDVELLSDYNQWVCACVCCHDKIEHDEDLTEEVFKRLRS